MTVSLSGANGFLKPAVLQLVDSFNQGGSEWQALQLTRLLCESGRFRIYLASLSSEGPLRDTIADLNLGDLPTFPLQSFYDRNAVKQLRRLVQLLKSLRIEIIHTHDFYTNVFGMAGAALARPVAAPRTAGDLSQRRSAPMSAALTRAPTRPSASVLSQSARTL